MKRIRKKRLLEDETYVPFLSEANFVGSGFNIYGTHNINSVTLPLFDPDKAKTKDFFFLDQKYLIPKYVVGAEQTSGYFHFASVSTREEFQNSISANANVEGSYGAFSGQMTASYGKQVSTSSLYSYAYRNQYIPLGLLTLIPETEYLTDYFIESINNLPKEFDPNSELNREQFADFFDEFGAYYVERVTLGGTLQYYAAVEKTAQTTTQEISASVEAEYKGIFASGGVSADFKQKDSWQQYYTNRSVNILGDGGDPTLIAQLLNIDANDSTDNASAANSTEIFNAWNNSIKTDPAVVNFQLSGIWNLTGDKRKAVESAFLDYGKDLRPNIVIETTGSNSSLKNPIKPIIFVDGGLIVPDNEPDKDGVGFLMVILDRSDISLAGVKLKSYYTYDSTQIMYYTYQKLYEDMLNAINQGGFNDSGNVLVLASYGVNLNAPPTPSFYSLLLSAGGGEGLRTWLNTVGSPGSYVASAINYSFVGIFKSGQDAGVDLYYSATSEDNISATELEVFFYNVPGKTQYTVGPGSSKIINLSTEQLGDRDLSSMTAHDIKLLSEEISASSGEG